jgi:hypothetical protein
VLECVLVREQQRLHVPERLLSAMDGNRLRRFRRESGVRVQIAVRKVPEHEEQTVAERLPHGCDDRTGASTVGTRVVAVFHENDRRVDTAEAVIARTRRLVELVGFHHGFPKQDGRPIAVGPARFFRLPDSLDRP